MSAGGVMGDAVVRRPSRIDFGVDQHGHPQQWVALSMAAADRLGGTSDRTFPAWFRVWMLGLARMERCGHAPFAQGELVALFSADSNGVLTNTKPENVAKGVDRAIRDAVESGLLVEGSGRRCLMLPSDSAQRGQGKISCPQHGTRA